MVTFNGNNYIISCNTVEKVSRILLNKNLVLLLYLRKIIQLDRTRRPRNDSRSLGHYSMVKTRNCELVSINIERTV